MRERSQVTEVKPSAGVGMHLRQPIPDQEDPPPQRARACFPPRSAVSVPPALGSPGVQTPVSLKSLAMFCL